MQTSMFAAEEIFVYRINWWMSSHSSISLLYLFDHDHVMTVTGDWNTWGEMNWQRCYCHTCPSYKTICSVSTTASRSTHVFCWWKALDCQDRAFHVFTRRHFSYGEKVLLNVKLWDLRLRYFSFRFSLTFWKLYCCWGPQMPKWAITAFLHLLQEKEKLKP